MLTQSLHTIQQFHLHPGKGKHVHTKLVDKRSKQRNSGYLRSGKNSNVHQLTNGQNVFYPVNELLSIPQ